MCIFLDLCSELEGLFLFNFYRFWLLQSMTEALESQVKSKVSIKVYLPIVLLMNSTYL